MEFIYALPTILLFVVQSMTPTYELQPGQTVIASYLVNEEAELYDPLVVEGLPDYFEELAEDRATHEWMWDFVIESIDEVFVVEHVVGFDIFIDTPDDDLLAYVIQSWDDPEKWIVSFDIEDMQNEGMFYQTAIHELAHLITLGAHQVEMSHVAFYADLSDPIYQERYDQVVATCETYFTGEGCAHSDSYIYQFTQTFWRDLFSTYGPVDTNQGDIDFYVGRGDQFVTSYASTNPGEDIAESFMFFVIRSKAEDDSVASAKQNFFYQYPEFVELRDNIRGYLGDARLRMSFKSNKER